MSEPERLTDAVTLYAGECTPAVLATYAAAGFALVTDPPYGLGKLWRGGTRQWRMAANGAGTAWDAETVPWLSAVAPQFGFAVVWGGSYYQLPPARGWLVWDKIVRKFTSGHCELAWTNIDQPVRAFNYSHGQLATEGKQHPTQKPLPLMRWCLSFLPPAVPVVDPFAGSGTTGLACERDGRPCVLFEKEPAYCDIIRRRLAEPATLFAGAS